LLRDIDLKRLDWDKKDIEDLPVFLSYYTRFFLEIDCQEAEKQNPDITFRRTMSKLLK
jgi:hypothetical protein